VYDPEERITKVIDCIEGTTITTQYTYDAQGNPLNYLGHTLTWEKGRQLKSFDGIAYTYNANGIRTSKTVDNIRHDYLLDGVNILRETWGNNVLEPLYDNEESVCGIVYNGVPYYFQKNLQGDIIAIADQNGEVVARYTYDAWGKCEISVNSTNAAIAEINPYRYRGYYFDTETGFYYLQSRYYDPVVGRFVNGDDPQQVVLNVSVFSVNLFSYCWNGTIVNADRTGEAFLTALLIGFAVGAIISGAAKVISNRKKGKPWYSGLAITMIAGGVGGAISCISIPGVSSWVCAAVFGAAGNLVTKVILGEIKSLKDVTSAILAGAAAGLLGNAAAKILNKFISASFAKWTKAQQKNFLGKIGRITNRQIKTIRSAIKKTGGTKVIEKSITKVLDKYGYPTVVSAFVSSTATSV
jgi:RHS repeat-associated protein